MSVRSWQCQEEGHNDDYGDDDDDERQSPYAVYYGYAQDSGAPSKLQMSGQSTSGPVYSSGSCTLGGSIIQKIMNLFFLVFNAAMDSRGVVLTQRMLDAVADNIDMKDAEPISDLKPELWVHSRGDSFKMSYEEYFAENITALRSKGILDGKRIIFIVHGFLNTNEESWMHEMKDAMLRDRDQHVVLVGWGRGADIGATNYPQAAGNTQAVGEWLGQLTSQIRKVAPGVYMWGVGHSLGAHVLGKAGRTGMALDRITGLDPAGPLFELKNSEKRLNRNDAPFVDVIHTDGYRPNPKLSLRILSTTPRLPITVLDLKVPGVNHFGTTIPIGTVDFYPNGGRDQPGTNILNLVRGHELAHQLFIWSIDNPGKLTTSYVYENAPTYDKVDTKIKKVQEVEMGYHADKYPHAKGNYYLDIGTTAPPKQ